MKLQHVPLGLQHVLIMYAGTVAVPLVFGAALQLPKDDIAFLVSADLMIAGLITILQSLGLGPFGIRRPVVMGVSFAALNPMLAIAGQADLGLAGVFGAVMAAGLITVLLAPILGRLLPLFPPVVTGSIILLVGLSLLKIGIEWSAGGMPVLTEMVDGQKLSRPNPDFANSSQLLVAGFVLAIILILQKSRITLVQNLSILLGVGAGCILSAFQGHFVVSGLEDSAWFALNRPLAFGMPTFSFGAIMSMSIVMFIVVAESLGKFIVIGEICEETISRQDLVRGLRAGGLGAALGGFFNTFPLTVFSQNVGLLSLTKDRDARVTAVGGVILLILSSCPKLSLLVASIPPSVLGGAGLVMFGMIAATGIRILSSTGGTGREQELVIVAVSLSVGMIPILVPNFFQSFPSWSNVLTESSIVLGALTAVLLNLWFRQREA